MLRIFHFRCIALNAIGVFIVEELIHCKGHPKVHDCICVLLVPGIEPTTYISAVGGSTDGKIPAAVEVKFLRDDYFR